MADLAQLSHAVPSGARRNRRVRRARVGAGEAEDETPALLERVDQIVSVKDLVRHLGWSFRRGIANLVGMDVVEVSPPFDQSEITAIAAAHIACDLLCVLRNRKLAGKL